MYCCIYNFGTQNSWIGRTACLIHILC